MAGETPAQKSALEGGEKAALAAIADQVWPTDAFGTPLVKITAAAAELVPTVQYGNATIGPVQITRFVPEGTLDQIKAELKATMVVCEQAVAEDRQTLHEQIRARSASGG